MGTPVPLGPIIIKYQGLFDFDLLYSTMVDWAKNYGYFWHEKTYKHKVPSPMGAEQEIDWETEKKVTEYIKYTIKMKIHIFDLTEIEVDSNGKKKSLSNGRMVITLNGIVEADYENIFGGGWLAKKLGGWYLTLWSKNLDNYYIDPLWYRMWNLQALIKKVLDMQTKKYAYKNYLGEG
ncbi:hypothetical protein HYV86_00545 [Candidatus Woesearchaeota archaeon]|nr:hypothetical protein [Candidatus Woesearchaeota archaeon]